MTAIHRVLFDLDGTLTDPSEGITKCLEYALSEMDLQAPPPEQMHELIGPPLAEIFTVLGVQDQQVPRAITLYRDRFSSVGLFENQMYDRVPEMLDELRSFGLDLRIATSKPTVFARRILEHFAIANDFSHISGATLDGTRSEKSDVIAHAIHDVGTKDAVMIGDRKHDLRGAASHQMNAIAVTWGFGSREELAAERPWRTVDRVMDLVAALT